MASIAVILYNAAMKNSSSIIVGAVLLCGGKVPASLVSYCRHRALLRVNGQLLLSSLLNTLQNTPQISGCVVVAPEDALSELTELPAILSPAGDKLVETMRSGVQALSELPLTHILFVTGDIPLVTSQGMQVFLDDCFASEAALCYPIIPRQACEARFPGSYRTYVKIRDGVFTGGNAILCSCENLSAIYEIVEALYVARKNPLQLAKILGWSTVARMLTGQLTLSYLEKVASRLINAPVRAIITSHAEIGFDVDKEDDLRTVTRAMTG